VNSILVMIQGFYYFSMLINYVINKIECTLQIQKNNKKITK